MPDSEVNKLQERQRVAVERVVRERDGSTSSLRGKRKDDTVYSMHPDLQDLSFGPLGNDQRFGSLSTLRIPVIIELYI